MGQNFSLTAFQAGSAGLDTPELGDMVYEKSMGQARFMKSIRARQQDGVVMVKVFVKPYTYDLSPYRRAILRESPFWCVEESLADTGIVQVSGKYLRISQMPLVTNE